MSKKKSKKSKKGRSLNYKFFVVFGGVFHYIMYRLYNFTLYNDTLLWSSLFLSGLILGIYFIKKLKLLHPKSYKTLSGPKLKAYMFGICFLVIIGATAIFGNVINGTLVGLNYLGKSSTPNYKVYPVQKITQYRTGGRKRRRRNNPKVFFLRDGEVLSIRLPERYRVNTNYAEYKTIRLDIREGLLGFEVINDYELRKEL